MQVKVRGISPVGSNAELVSVSEVRKGGPTIGGPIDCGPECQGVRPTGLGFGQAEEPAFPVIILADAAKTLASVEAFLVIAVFDF